MLVSLLRFQCAVIALTLVLVGSAHGASLGSVSVSVRDGASGLPVAHAHVHLESDTTALDGFTGRDGILDFPSVVPGKYAVVLTQPAYKFDRLSLLVVGPGQQHVSYRGIRTRLPEIVRSVSQRPTAARALPSAAGADVAGAILGEPLNIPSINGVLPGKLSISGRQPNEGTATINGAAIFPSGSAIGLDILASDIFEGANIDGAAMSGAPAGSLALSTFSPTIDWQGIAEYRGASFFGESSGIRERGSIGRLGLSFVHAVDSQSDSLGGRYYNDASGSLYQHDTQRTVRGDTFTGRYPFGQNNVAFLDLGRLSVTTPLSCTDLMGSTPCGYGPGNGSNQIVDYWQLRGTATVDRASFDAHVFGSTSSSRDLFGAERFLGTSVGYEDAIVTRRFGATLRASYLLKHGVPLTFSYSGTRDESAVRGTFTAGTGLPYSTTSVESVTVQIPAFSTKRWNGTFEVGKEGVAGRYASTAGFDGSYALDVRKSIGYDLSIGHRAAPRYSSSGISAVSDLRYDCDGGALGEGPSSSDIDGGTSAFRASYNYKGARVTESLGASYEDVRSGGMFATVPVTTLAGNLVPPGYLVAASAAATTLCGRPQTILPARFYLHVGGTARRVEYTGLDASVEADLGTRIHVGASYALRFARATGVVFDRSNPKSGNISQLERIPIQSGTFSASFRASPSLSPIVGLTYYGRNNAFMQRSFLTVDAGIRVLTGNGDLTVAVQNIGNAGPNGFMRFAPFPLLETAVAPRSYSVRYRLPIGNRGIDHTPLLNAPIVAASANLFFVPTPFEDIPEAKWLDVDTTSPFCGPELAGPARRLLAAIGAYRDYVSTALASSAPVEQRNVDGIAFSYEPSRLRFTIRMVFPNDTRVLAPLWKCARLHEGTYDQARVLGIYTPTWEERYSEGAGTLYFAPQAGLYFAPDPVDATVGSRVASATFPTRLPISQTRIVAAVCPVTFAESTTEIMGALAKYIASWENGGHPFAPEGTSIVTHKSKAGSWLEIAFDDASFADAFALCANIPDATLADMKRFGLGAPIQPSIGYAAGFGFYRLAQ